MEGTLKEIIEHHMRDEMEDSKNYTLLSQKAYEDDMEEASGILQDIAHDEMTHAKALSHILEKGVL